MIKRKHQMTSEQRSAMRGGSGTITITHLFGKGELKSPTRLCARLTIPAGASIGMHPHDNEEEVYYVLSGRCRINDNGIEEELCPGDAVLTGGGASHSVTCLSTEPCELMAFIPTFA